MHTDKTSRKNATFDERAKLALHKCRHIAVMLALTGEERFEMSVHGKGPLMGKMPGDLWQKFANMRLLFAYMYAQPAKKLLFMGGEFGQWAELSHESSLEWHLLQYESHTRFCRNGLRN